MEITVDTEDLQKILKLMQDFTEAEQNPYRYILFSDAKTLLQELLNTQLKTSKLQKETPKPDPRCDGCEVQHPFAQNLSYDITTNKVYCKRGMNPTYYKEGKTIRHPSNLMICHVYYLDNETLVQFKPEYNPPCAKYCIPEIEKIMQREIDNHRAIIEILDMLVEYSAATGRAKSTNDCDLQSKAYNLKEKLEQSSENIN